MEGVLLHRPVVLVHDLLGNLHHLIVEARLGRCAPVERLTGQRDQTADSVAKIVREIAVEAFDAAFVGKLSVLAEDHIAQQEEPQTVGSVPLDQIVRSSDVTDRLRHLALVAQPPTVGPDGARQGQARRHQKRRPVDGMESEDVLADEVNLV